MSRCPVCGNWRWREEDRPDEEGHHPDCGVNVRRTREALEAVKCWRGRRLGQKEATAKQ